MRSGAKGFIRPFRDDPTIRIPIRWYRAHPLAKVLELETCFIFDQWNKEDQDALFPGYENEYTYDKGINTLPPPTGNFCGTPEQWRIGPLSTDPSPPIDPATNLPACCFGIGPFDCHIFGGFPWDFAVPPPCQLFGGNPSTIYTLTISGGIP